MLLVLLGLELQELAEVIDVVVTKVLDLATRGVETLLDGEVDALVAKKTLNQKHCFRMVFPSSYTNMMSPFFA